MNISDYLTKQLQSGEDLIRVVRRHPATLFPSVGLGSFIILLDFFLVTWWFRHHQWGVIGFSLVVVFGIIVLVRGIYSWSHNVLAVTSDRVIDINQHGFFERNVTEATYDKIQDVRYTIRGLWPTLFRFGTIVVQTANATTPLELADVQHPAELQQLITDIQRQSTAQRGNGNVTAAELLHVVDRLKREIGPEGVDRVLRQSAMKNFPGDQKNG